jgi:hypothetical protein
MFSEKGRPEFPRSGQWCSSRLQTLVKLEERFEHLQCADPNFGSAHRVKHGGVHLLSACHEAGTIAGLSFQGRSLLQAIAE